MTLQLAVRRDITPSVSLGDARQLVRGGNKQRSVRRTASSRAIWLTPPEYRVDLCTLLVPYLPSRTNYRGRSVNISEVRKWDVAQVKSSLYGCERGRRDWWHAIGHTHQDDASRVVRSICDFVCRQLFREIKSHCSEVFGLSIIMDSSVSLGRLELARPLMTRGSCLPEGAQSAHLNGCVPLSHQVAGHKYGVDKVGQYTFHVIPFDLSLDSVIWNWNDIVHWRPELVITIFFLQSIFLRVSLCTCTYLYLCIKLLNKYYLYYPGNKIQLTFCDNMLSLYMG